MYINILAILVAVIAHMIIGTLWYSRFLFGKQWASLIGISLEEKPAPYKMLLMFIASLLTAFILSVLLFFLAPLYILAVMIALAVWIGFILPTTLNPILWVKKSWKLFFINAGFYLVSLLVMVTILYLL